MSIFCLLLFSSPPRLLADQHTVTVGWHEVMVTTSVMEMVRPAKAAPAKRAMVRNCIFADLKGIGKDVVEVV